LNYISELRSLLKLDPSVSDEFLREMNDHIEEKSAELRESGLSAEDARDKALREMGPASLIASQIYEVYSQGSWKQALSAALPHVLIAILFALHLMLDVRWIIALTLLVAGASVYGWSRGKPTWLFPWLGCLLLPAIMTGTLLIYLPSGWTWFAAITYIPLAAFVLILVIRQFLKRDWLFISLTLLPVPIALGWILAFSLSNKFLNLDHIYSTASWIALSFAILALTAATFVRVRRRWLKTVVLIIPEILVLSVVALYSGGYISFGGWLLICLMALGLILGPAFLERTLKRKKG
jgi:hypothetical protein